MLDPEHPLWGQYEQACKLHEEKFDIAERVNTEDARRQATRAAEQAGELLKDILRPAKRLKPRHAVAEILKKHLLENGMCNATDVVEQTGLTVDEMRKAMDLLKDRLRLDTVQGRLKMWLVKDKYAQFKPEDIDEAVRRYMTDTGRFTIDDCAHHLGIQTAKIRQSVMRIGYPRLKIVLSTGALSWKYYPHGTDIATVQDEQRYVQAERNHTTCPSQW